jgi:Glycosyl transferase family 2
MKKTNREMRVSRIMVWFHFSFTVFGLVALFLMITKIITLDWLALWIIALAVALNAFFTIMWYDETKEKPAPPSAFPQPVVTDKPRSYPMVSLIVTSYNQGTTIADSLRRLFKCVSDYRGPSEIVLVDDGSTDDTYEMAWETLDSMHKELPHIRARAIKHMSHLGKTETAKTGSNKAMGEYLILTDATVTCDSVSINSLIDSLYTTEENMINYDVTPQPQHDKTEALQSVLLAHSDALRRLLDKETTDGSEITF